MLLLCLRLSPGNRFYCDTCLAVQETKAKTLAGFEGGTRIYLNTIDPWKVVERTVPRLLELREAGLIAPMRIGEECKVSPAMLRG